MSTALTTEQLETFQCDGFVVAVKGNGIGIEVGTALAAVPLPELEVFFP